MNQERTEAIANADAHLSNVGLPTYSELVALAQSAVGIAAWHVPANQVRDASEVDRIRVALALFAVTSGMEA